MLIKGTMSNSEETIQHNIPTNGSTNPTLSTILLGRTSDDVAYKMISFLPTKDILGLHSVNKACHNLISAREDVLFDEFLRRDFDEGNILSYVANERKLCRKKLYLAFLHRVSLPKHVVDNGDKRITIPWRRPAQPQLETEVETDENYELENEDVASLVFIARIGSGFNRLSKQRVDPHHNKTMVPPKLITLNNSCAAMGVLYHLCSAI